MKKLLHCAGLTAQWLLLAAAFYLCQGQWVPGSSFAGVAALGFLITHFFSAPLGAKHRSHGGIGARSR